MCHASSYACNVLNKTCLECLQWGGKQSKSRRAMVRALALELLLDCRGSCSPVTARRTEMLVCVMESVDAASEEVHSLMESQEIWVSIVHARGCLGAED